MTILNKIKKFKLSDDIISKMTNEDKKNYIISNYFYKLFNALNNKIKDENIEKYDELFKLYIKDIYTSLNINKNNDIEDFIESNWQEYKLYLLKDFDLSKNGIIDVIKNINSEEYLNNIYEQHTGE